MASKLSRAEAGRRVAALADSLSDRLVADELAAKEAMEGLFAGGMSVTMGLVGETDKVVRAARSVVEATAGPYAALAHAAVEKALTSVGEELDLCEQTLAKKYAGITDEAIVACRPFAEQMAIFSGDAYLTQARTVVPWFRERLISELKTSLAENEDIEVLQARLFAPRPVGLANHSGRGLWWKMLEHCHRVTRESEIATVNVVRERAMSLFNTMGAARDGSGS